jgi:hypothetical protein
MATARQVIPIKLASLIVAGLTTWWWWAGFGWIVLIVAAVINYVIAKVIFSVAIGLYQGSLLRGQMDAMAADAVDIADKMRRKAADQQRKN